MRVGVYHPQLFAFGIYPAFGIYLYEASRFLTRYTSPMSVILFGMRLLEVLFFVGIAGSAIVVVIATGEDIRELVTKTKHVHAAEKTPTA
jgi:hypothetical protein